MLLLHYKVIISVANIVYAINKSVVLAHSFCYTTCKNDKL